MALDRSAAAGVNFNAAEIEGGQVDERKLYTLQDRLTVLHRSIVKEDGSTNMTDDVVYCVLLARWIHALKNSRAATSSVQLWFPMPENSETNCALAELYFRTYQASQRMLRFASAEDITVPGDVYPESVIDYDTRYLNLRLCTRLLGVMEFLEKHRWNERELTLTRMGLSPDYKDNIRNAVHAYALWNMACMKAESLKRSVESPGSVPYVSKDRIRPNDTKLLDGLVGIVGGIDSMALLEQQARLERSGDTPTSGVLPQRVFNPLRVTGMGNITSGKKKSSPDTSVVGGGVTNLDDLKDPEDSKAHILDRPSKQAQQRDLPGFGEKLQEVAAIFKSCRSLLSELPEEVDLCGSDKSKSLSASPDRWTSKDRKMWVLVNGCRKVLDVDVPKSTATTTGRSLFKQKGGWGGSMVAQPWSVMAQVHFLFWLGRYMRLHTGPHDQVACFKCVIANGGLAPITKILEENHYRFVGAKAVPDSCWNMIQNCAAIRKLYLVTQNCIKDPLL